MCKTLIVTRIIQKKQAFTMQSIEINKRLAPPGYTLYSATKKTHHFTQKCSFLKP